jgi:hypothetical protein
MSGLSLTAANSHALYNDIKAANAAGGANTITLTASTLSPYILTLTNNTYGANGLPVIAANDNLTIVGSGDTIERTDGSSAPYFRLFAVAPGGSLTMQNLTLQGGWDASGYGGGAIFNTGTLILNDVTVQDNVGKIDGGGIYSSQGSVTLEGGSIVRNNKAIPVGIYGTSYGGGLYVSGGTVSLSNATVESNSADYGGGLYVSGGTVSLSNATVESNTAGYGGGLYVGSSTATLSNDTLESNTAYYFGGGLYVGSGIANLANDTVESNKAELGGGLYVSGGTVTLSGDTVESNTASAYSGGTPNAYGGGICIVSSSTIYPTVYLDSFTVANTINNTDEWGLNGIGANIYGNYILQSP